VPFADELFDRWEKARYLGFGAGTSIYDDSLVIGDVEVGSDTWIGPFTVLDGSGGLTIGCHCAISSGVQIYSHDSVARTLSGGTAPIDHAGVSIGDRTYIGPHAVISGGISVGSECVIGAGAFVNRDVADRSIVVGAPARRVGRVELEDGNVELIYDRDSAAP